MSINVLAIGGSLRKASTNQGLLRFAKENAPSGINIEIANLADIPFYNQDTADIPQSVEVLFEQMKKADAFLFGCPEYNYSIAPALKNALDWASREKDNYLLANKTAAIVGAGGGMGTSRAQYHLRQVCTCLNITVLNKPEVFSSAFGGSFDTEGNLIDERIQQLVLQQLDALASLQQQLKK